MILLAAFHGGNRYVGPYAICSMKYTIFCIVSFCHLANLKLKTTTELKSCCKVHINSFFDVCLMILKVNSESSAVSITNLHVHNDKDPLISFYFMV